MTIRVEIYTAGGIAVGVVARAGHLREALEAGGSLRVEEATWHPIDDTPAGERSELTLHPDDIHVAIAEEAEDLPVHAQWHDIVLDVGPYRVLGQLATMPGFDPGRALARPTGEFVQLRDITISLHDEEGTGLPRPMALVNRYVVDRVEADLMLGFFFPGAEMITTKVEEPLMMFIPAAPEPTAEAAPASDPTPGDAPAEVPGETGPGDAPEIAAAPPAV